MRKTLISLWWSIGRLLLRESPDSPLPECLGSKRSCHVDLNDVSSWLDAHPDVRLTDSQQRPLMLAMACRSLSPSEKTLFFAALESVQPTRSGNSTG